MKSSEDKINELFDKKLKTKTDEIAAQRDAELAQAKELSGNIDRDYTAAKNAESALAEKQRQNFNAAALASGLNAGAGSQAQLAMNAAAQKTDSMLEAQRLEAHEKAARNGQDIENRYRREIAQAIEENDYERAKAIFEEYRRGDSQAEKEAKIKSGYGDFSGYEALYGKETAEAMRSMWIAKNPQLARNLGLIDEQQYRRLTKK